MSAPVTFIKKVAASDMQLAATWRKRWDSNPRAREGYLISSQARYDHFDTLPFMSTPVPRSQTHIRFC